jgi:PAS domain S-box-containing protein
VWNEGARRIMGWTEAEVLGTRTHRMFTPEDIADWQPEQEMKRAVDQGHATDERWHQRKDGSRFWASGMMTPLRIESGEHIGYVKILRDRTAEREAEEHGKLLAAELQHRVKNTLAMVQAIANQTFREVAPAEVRAAFTARMVALGDAHGILTQANWTAAPLRDVARTALAPHEDGENRFDLDGPNIRLAAKPALALALALHELATNAAKYGALSNGAGRVEVTWRIEDERFRFRWAERGGPAVSPPTTKGFGSRLIERSLAAEFGGDVRIDYEPAGVVCRIEAPLDAISEA